VLLHVVNDGVAVANVKHLLIQLPLFPPHCKPNSVPETCQLLKPLPAAGTVEPLVMTPLLHPNQSLPDPFGTENAYVIG